jgi:uncharacterized protein (UPF0548 family)
VSRRRPADHALDTVLRVRPLARWVVGAAVTLWPYLTRTTQVEREEITLPGTDPGPADRPVPGDQAPVQPRSAGAGASMRRRYQVRVVEPRLSPGDLMAALARDPNLASPFEMARFVKTAGLLGEMAVGDEYVVWLPGPWNGPVRVADRTPTSFRLATLAGHVEAGEIEFRARSEDGDLVFEIESVARSGSRGAWVLFGLLHLGKEIQLHMWVRFCEAAAELAGGRPAGPVRVQTTRHPDDRGIRSHGTSRRARRAFARLQTRDLNFDPASLDDTGPGSGWTVDDHSADLPAEPPGPPAPGGSFEVARRLVRNYAFADPSLIRAVYRPDERLVGRNMLLEGRFMGLRFMLGARVAAVLDGIRTIEGRPAHVWGWSYRTLEGHLEQGQMDFEVLKWPDEGAVRFRIHAVSRRAAIPNPIVRLGFRLFGRRLQLRFARRACERMGDQVARALRERGAPAAAADGPVEVEVRSAGAEGA